MATEISTTAFGNLQADVEHIRAAMVRVEAKLEPLALARSGDIAIIAGMQRDLNSSHEKLREHGRRMDQLERQFERAKWLVVGAVAVVQVLWGIIGPSILRSIGIGG